MRFKGLEGLKGYQREVAKATKAMEQERARLVRAIELEEKNHQTFENEMLKIGVKPKEQKADAADEFAKEMARLGVVKLAEVKTKSHAPRRKPIPHQTIMDEKRVLTESLSDEFDSATYLEHDEDLFFVRPGVGDDVVRNLRRGFWTIQAHLDLHGMRTDDAREAVALFIHRAVKHELRCVRIVHGKGLNSQGAPILKIRTRRWLRQKEEVLAFVECPPEDGGSGAVRILLAKKNRGY